MPNNIPDCKKKEFSRYDSMSDEELRAFLQLDASKPEGEASDIDEVLYVMELLSVRRKERGESRDPYKAFEEFKAHYAPPNSFPETVPVKQRVLSRWHRVAAIAAVLALLIGATATVGATKFDLREIIAKWTKETFYLSEAGKESIPLEENTSKDNTFPYDALQAMLNEHNITECIVPTWIPEGFEQIEQILLEFPEGTEYHVYHRRNENEMAFHVKEYSSVDPLHIERSSSLIEVYTVADTDYYIFENNNQLQVAWVNNNLECWFYGDISLSEAKQMIDSIEKD